VIFEAKRSESDIIQKILSETRDGIKKTQLMYNANMSNTQLTRYLDILLKKEFIKEKENGDGKKYHLTDKGTKLLDPLNEVITIIHEN
jgi:predicted transcriptional regulator